MATWKIDASHSEITFKVKHLVISTVSGKFNEFDATVEAEKDDFSDAQVSFSAKIDSISTGNEQRDGHLKSADFFDAAGHPELTFKSTSLKHISGSDYELTGDLTIRGTTKPVTLKAEFGGIQNDFYGNTVAGFELTGKINRQEFGLTWSAVTEAGGVVVSDDVKLAVNVELIKQK
ncbi:YceI family protein [Flavihumibacter cheonanensis]|uniref:YceI family protein n=1 Tax=Flavihumibacter cheonanensis TaxID=1442385 RepID=UPI001EF84219|nr:YceI family protein [Flavihumibacter cheonanensis]MCG7754439.1 YceI family protein [Flavihumibacter cheonanensis]